MATTVTVEVHHPSVPQRDRRVYLPTTVAAKSGGATAAPLASSESLIDDVAPASGVLLAAAPPSTGTDSGRGSPSTLAETSLSWTAQSDAPGHDSGSLFGGAAPTAMPGDDAGLELRTTAWDSEVDGWAVKPVIEAPVNLSFHKISYAVQSRARLRLETRRILHGVSGEFRAGQLTAIMGPSGAGKSTLLDVLSGYTSTGVRGHLMVNGKPRDTSAFRRGSVYIQQDASLHPHFTVMEAMNVAAILKLGSRGAAVRRTITEALQSLGLLEHADTKTANLSGGQLKRLATALEILSNPPVMFFDEPTSGLDSSTSKQCVGVLRRLARQGRTVVCTIHQPSATVFEMLDQLYLLVDGRCAYTGHTANLLPYLAGLGLRCPPYHNPADYVLEVAGCEYGDHTDSLVKAIENGRCDLWATTSTAKCKTGVEGGLSGTLTRHSSTSTTSESLTSRKSHCRPNKMSELYPTSFWLQLYVLLKRSFSKGLRDRMLCHSRLYIHLLLGLLIGALFLNIGGDAAHIFHNFSLLFFSLMFLMFTALSAMILAFPLEMPIIAREHFNRWYSLKSYFLAVTLADVPLQGICIIIYTSTVYYMTAQPMEVERYFLFVIICSLVAFVAQSFGLVVGAGLKVEHGVIFGPLCILPFTIFSGFFVHQRDAPGGMQWLFTVSYLKYGISGLMQAVYGYNREPLGCTDAYCHFTQPEKFLHQLSMDESNFWFDAAVLLAIGSVLRLAAYYVLKYRLMRFRQ